MSDEAPPEASAKEGSSRLKGRILWGLRIGGTALGFGYVASIVEVGALTNALGRVSAVAFLMACLVTALNLCVGAARWRILLSAYGAPHRPSLLFLIRVYYIGFFYNNYVPGGVGGDIVRGVVTRRSFGEKGTTASMTVVLVERVLGLTGLMILVSVTSLIRPIEGTENVLPYSAFGLVLAAGAVSSVAVGRRVAHLFPGRVGALLGSLPVIERGGAFALCLGMSLITQALVAVTGWFLLSSITGGEVTLFDALVLVPLGMAAAFFPLSVGGAGVREAAFVGLFVTALGMARADALAVSLLLWISQLALGAIGGVVQLAAPIRERAEP